MQKHCQGLLWPRTFRCIGMLRSRHWLLGKGTFQAKVQIEEAAR